MSGVSRALVAASVLAISSDVALPQSTTTLPPVTVEGARQPSGVNRSNEAGQPSQDSPPVEQTTAGPVQGYRALTGTSATKTETPLERIPQNIVVIPRSVIDAQSAVTVSEAVRNVSNVQPMNPLVVANTEIYQLRLRGFPAEVWRDGLVDFYTTGSRDGLASVERIEVIKGPNAILYGGGTGAPIGGTVNIVSKLPTDKRSYEVGGTFGSYGLWNPYFDINQPLNNEKTVLFRITGEYSQSKSNIDVLTPKNYSINPTLTFTNRSDTSLTIQGFASRFEQQAYPGLPVFGTILGDYRVQRNLYFGNPDIPKSYSRNSGVVATFDHEFSRIWSANVKVRWSESQFDQKSQSALGFDLTGGMPVAPPSTFDVNNVRVYQMQQEFTVNPTLKAKFSAGPADNIFLFGTDYSRITSSGFMRGAGVGVVDLSNPSFPAAYTDPPPGPFTSFFEFSNVYVAKGAYAQVQSTIYDRVHLLAGIREGSLNFDYTEKTLGNTFTTDTTRALPRAGAVVDLFRGLSVYASYSEGMKWAEFTARVTPAPELSQQREAGFKFNINEKLTGTIAAFQIDRANVPITTGAGTASLSNQRATGYEADLIYQPDRHWSLLASYGHTDAKFSDAFLNTITGVVTPAGNRIPMISRDSGRFWAEYKFGPGTLDGWSVGAGVFAASGQYVDSPNLWRTSGYHTVDAKVGYENDKFRAAVTVKNLTGQEYYTPYAWLGGQVAPSAPRAIYGQISYKFQ